MEYDSPWKEVLEEFQKEVISLALLIDDNPRFRPREYHLSRWGCEVIFRYPSVKIIDYREQWAELEDSSHPFAIIVKSYLRTLETEGNVKSISAVHQAITTFLEIKFGEAGQRLSGRVYQMQGLERCRS